MKYAELQDTTLLIYWKKIQKILRSSKSSPLIAWNAGAGQGTAPALRFGGNGEELDKVSCPHQPSPHHSVARQPRTLGCLDLTL